MQKPGFSVPILILLLLGTCMAHAQEHRTEICVYFRVNRTDIDSAYLDNANRIREIITTLRNIRQDSTINIVEVSFCGAASPEGSYQLNRKLAHGRLSALEKLVRQQVNIPDSLITRDESYIPWDYLRSQVEKADLRQRDKILSIIDEEPRLVNYHSSDRLIDHRIVKLKQLEDQRIWQQLYHMFFERMRNAYAVIVTYKQEIPPISDPIVVPLRLPETKLSIPPLKIQPVVTPVPATRFFSVKTNLLFAALLTANLGFEIELWPKWSLDVPVWYSPYDITPTRKLRLWATQPEIRRWLKKAGEGHFFGLHTHIVGFNVAINNHGRYQDPNHALWGMGLSYGYVMHLDKAKRWGLEFNLGVGFAEYDYDVYRNRENGPKFRSGSDRYWGITRAGVTLSYKWYKERKNRRWMKW